MGFSGTFRQSSTSLESLLVEASLCDCSSAAPPVLGGWFRTAMSLPGSALAEGEEKTVERWNERGDKGVALFGLLFPHTKKPPTNYYLELACPEQMFLE